jgi:hypothetical protein
MGMNPAEWLERLTIPLQDVINKASYEQKKILDVDTSDVVLEYAYFRCYSGEWVATQGDGWISIRGMDGYVMGWEAKYVAIS